MSIKHLSTLMFLVPILLGANNSHGPVGKTYKALVNETCKSMTDGGCMIYTYQVLKFEQDSVKVSYQAIASCSPKEMEDNYKEMYKNQIKKYKWHYLRQHGQSKPRIRSEPYQIL